MSMSQNYGRRVCSQIKSINKTPNLELSRSFEMRFWPHLADGGALVHFYCDSHLCQSSE